MAEFYKGVIPIVDMNRAADRDYVLNAGFGFGHDPSQVVEGMFAPPNEMKLKEESEWDAWYDEQEARRSSLEHIYLPDPKGPPAFVNLDQGQEGYCWGYSYGHANMMAALRDNQLNYRLNPHSLCAIIKHGRNEGGWCGLSAQFGLDNGCAEEGTGPGEWPYLSRNLKYDTPECRAAMAKHRTVEEWRDIKRPVYDQVLSRKQYATALMLNQPCPSDFNPLSHSMCTIRWVRVEKGSWFPLCLNSWKGWGRYGLAVFRLFPDGALTIRNSRAT